jgi:hypothetical protein
VQGDLRERGNDGDGRVAAVLLVLTAKNKPEYCPYGHSLAPGMPQKIS